MNYKVASISVLIIAVLAAFYKFEYLPSFVINGFNKFLNPFISHKSDKLVIWTATTVKDYDESVYEIIREVAQKLNYTVIKDSDRNGVWNVMWSYEYVFDRFPSEIRYMELKPNQIMNHFPAQTFLTNKLHLAVSSSHPFIPNAFNFPNLKNEFLYFAKLYYERCFIQKNMNNGGIKIVPFDQINFGMGSWSYLQLFIESFLIEGHAFDIGIYIIITSIEPLRIYKWNRDIILRICSEPFLPFDHKIIEKYVCSENYKNIWEIEAFKHTVESEKFSNKDILDNYLEHRGINSAKIWEDIDSAINTVVTEKIKIGHRFAKMYANQSGNSLQQMFELLRVDFILDNDAKVYLMEFNMSPEMNDGNDEYELKKNTYVQIVHDTLEIMGVRNLFELEGNSTTLHPQNIATSIEECSQCDESCESPSCELCLPCLSEDFKKQLFRSYKEHHYRGGYKRIFPTEDTKNKETKLEMTEETAKLKKWFKAKCQMDNTWC